MDAETSTNDALNWRFINLKNRMDSSQQEELVAEMATARNEGSTRIALDFRGNRFISLQAIRTIVTAAEELAGEGGEIALIGCIERVKRHFEIYGSLKHIRVARTEAELPRETRFAAKSVERKS